MKTDDEIKRDVEAELRYDPDIDPANIAVSVKSGGDPGRVYSELPSEV